MLSNNEIDLGSCLYSWHWASGDPKLLKFLAPYSLKTIFIHSCKTFISRRIWYSLSQSGSEFLRQSIFQPWSYSFYILGKERSSLNHSYFVACVHSTRNVHILSLIVLFFLLFSIKLCPSCSLRFSRSFQVFISQYHFRFWNHCQFF